MVYDGIDEVIMESAQLRIFATVARLESITRAAEALHTVQSNVTAHVRALEEELGTRLLHRHRRGVTLTRAGTQLLPFAIKTEWILDEARRAIGGRDRRPSGPLLVGTLETTAAIRLPKIVAQFGALYPQVDLSLITGTTHELSCAVLAYKLEGAFVAAPVLNPELVEEKVFEEEMVIVSSPRVSDLKQLAASGEVKIVVFREGCSYRVLLEKILHSKGVRKIRVAEFGTLDGILGCAAAGLGVTMLPRAIFRNANTRHKVRLHKLAPSESRVETAFIRARDGFVSPALSAFLDLVRQSGNGTQRAAGMRRPGAG